VTPAGSDQAGRDTARDRHRGLVRGDLARLVEHGRDGTATRLGLGVDGDGRTAPVIPETVSPTAETIRGRAPLSVNRTTAPARRWRGQALPWQPGAGRGVSRVPAVAGCAARTGLAARARPAVVCRGRRSGPDLARPSAAGHHRAALSHDGAVSPTARCGCAPLDGLSRRPASPVKLRCWTVRCTLARTRHVWERSVRCVREWRKGMRRAARGWVPFGRRSARPGGPPCPATA